MQPLWRPSPGVVALIGSPSAWVYYQDGTDALALETTMTLCTFDRSPSLNLALVATRTLRAPRYVPLALAPVEHATVGAPVLRQLHTVANGVVDGLTARQRARLDPQGWEMLGRQ